MKCPLKPLFTGLLFLLSNYLFSNDFSSGARSAGIGNASVSVTDEYSIFNNTGGLGRVSTTSFFAGAENRYGLREFNSTYAGLIYPAKLGTFGFSFNHFGDEVFNNQAFGFAYGNRFGIVSLGLKAGFQQYYFESFGSSSVFIAEFGGVAQIIPKLRFGTYIKNINQGKLKSEGMENEYVPVILKSGVSYLPISNLMLCIDVEKEVNKDVSLKGGVEYEIIKKVFMRVGMNSNPWRNFYGLGFNGRKIKIDYALATYSAIGQIHQVSISYIFKNRDGEEQK